MRTTQAREPQENAGMGRRCPGSAPRDATKETAMSMSMHCVAVKPPDEDYQRRAAAYMACDKAGIPIPKELDDFFGGEGPDPIGTTQHLGHGDSASTHMHPSCAKYTADMESGFEVDITKLPPGTRFVRFYCSW